ERHLQAAIEERESVISLEEAIAALDEVEAEPTPPPLLCDVVDMHRDLLREPAWCDAISHQIGQFCAAYFDRDQADWHPDRQADLYQSWREVLMQDHSVALLMHASGIAGKAAAFAETAEAQIQQCLQQLEVASIDRHPYLQAVLLRVSGWAAWCAYLRWQARLVGEEHNLLVDLLAIRLSWECLVDDGKRSAGSVWIKWQSAWRKHLQDTDERRLQVLLLWQRAHEISYQYALFGRLLAAEAPAQTTRPQVQAAFCIDVRSEVFRRHLEAQSPGIATIGFAGFFGLPISYAPIGTGASRPQLPGLLAPSLEISDTTGDKALDQKLIEQRQGKLRSTSAVRTFKAVPASAFTMVETLGLGYAAELLKRSLARSGTESTDALGLRKSQQARLRPTLDCCSAEDLEKLSGIVAGALKGMNLTQNFASLVLLIGHGSESINNPQRAGLDCGACCGQSGEVNARALASLLNDKAMRARLAQHGIAIPQSTAFVGGLHNTTTDEVTLFDTEPIEVSHASALREIRAQLAAAGDATRRERAPGLGLQDLAGNAGKLIRAMRRRANDWSETRPEWGLANNAAFIVAPRSRTRGLDLGGRSFLHEYDHAHDSDGALLEQILTAPMLVTHWINMQYFASTVDNRRYGSGNKTLHNVVGGRLGVFEGNGGDLRIGLAWQSVHDGEQPRHAPLRLTVVIDAPRDYIERVISRHETVSHLVQHQWLYLARWEGKNLELYRHGRREAWLPAGASTTAA
ncbi:MAG TPA: DUF2309 domain-containing protein, partial [Methylophilaceae bacterium]|nr:DUF2309 domain-containing protein [Methylophilaceae bacterium]